MKIESVQIKNIGPYIGDNTFSFDVTDSLRKMILIGGKNGAGKTTLFNAIKICLYGCVAYGLKLTILIIMKKYLKLSTHLKS